MVQPLLDPAIHSLWLSSSARGTPPPADLVARVQYDLTIAWHHREAFLDLPARINPNSARKSFVCREASRGSGKSIMVAFVRLYTCEYILPFLQRDGLALQSENRNYAIFGRNQAHLRDDIIAPLKSLIINRAPWLRTPDWREIIEDIDDPSSEGLREISEMKSVGLRKWESYRLDLANGVSIRTRTLKQSIRALHVLACDMDDPLTEQNVSESTNYKSLIQAAISPALEPGGLFLLDGTPQAPGDLFDLCKDDPDWDYKAYPAFDEDGTLAYAAKNLADMGEAAFAALPPNDQHCLWPARLPYAALEQARGSTAESETKYLREYQLKRILDSTSLVHPEDLLASRDPKASYHFHAEPNHIYSGGIDPSGRKKDDAAFALGFVTPDNVRHISHISKLLANPHLPEGEGEMSVIREANELSTRFSCLDWLVESNGFQGIIAPLLRALNPSIRMEKFALGSNKHTENGWLGLRTTFRSRLIKFPYCTPEDRRITDEAFDQLRGLQYIEGKVVEDPRRPNDIASAIFLFLKATEKAAPIYTMSAVSFAPPTVHTTPNEPPALRGTAEFGHQPTARRKTASVASILARVSRWQC